MPSERGSSHMLTLALVVVMAVCVVATGGLVLWSRRAKPVIDLPPPAPTPDVLRQPVVRPVSRAGYVGSQKCVACHEDIHGSYQTHPMSRSLAPVGKETPVEDWGTAPFQTSPVRRFEVTREEDGRQRHAEVLLDDRGEILRQEEEIAFALGSGQRGRSYLVNREGILFQSPIGWYSQAQQFDLSPGYHGAGNRHFLRRVGDGCLYCHSGAVSTSEPGSDRYDEHVFFEHAIGCERCHGPGERHIAFHSGGLPGLTDELPEDAGDAANSEAAGDEAAGDEAPEASQADPIVNPAKLGAEARDAVCYQCHLQGEGVTLRRGRTPFDFRPGDRIEDIWVAFVRPGAERVSRSVGQVQQMRSSTCFQQSEGRMGCISCHDPHRKPSAEQRVEFYNDRCLQCHESPDACAAPAEQREAAPAAGSCVHCHMPSREGKFVPHTAHTDHRVLRRPEPASPAAPRPAQGDYVVFAGAEPRLPKAELERARGLAMMTRADIAADVQRLRQAEYLMIPEAARKRDAVLKLSAIGDDTRVLNTLARNLVMRQRRNAALQCWQEVLKHDPKNEEALEALSSYYHQQGDTRTALKLLDKLAAANPYLPDIYGRRAHLYGQRSEMDLALPAAQMAIRLDPNNLQTQQWLAQALKLIERPEEAAEQADKAARIEAAMIRELEHFARPAPAPEP